MAKKYYVCIAETSVTGAPELEYGERFGVGAIVDLDRVVGSTMERPKDAPKDAPKKRRDWKLGELVNMQTFVETDSADFVPSVPSIPPPAVPRDADKEDD